MIWENIQLTYKELINKRRTNIIIWKLNCIKQMSPHSWMWQTRVWYVQLMLKIGS